MDPDYMSTDYGDYTDYPLRSRPQVPSVKNDNPSPHLCFVERGFLWDVDKSVCLSHDDLRRFSTHPYDIDTAT